MTVSETDRINLARLIDEDAWAEVGEPERTWRHNARAQSLRVADAVMDDGWRRTGLAIIGSDGLLDLIDRTAEAIRAWDEDNGLSGGYVGMLLRSIAEDSFAMLTQAHEALFPLPESAGATEGLPCGCGSCVADRAEALREAGAPFSEIMAATSVFIVCPDCGDKRCPRADTHKKACQKRME